MPPNPSGPSRGLPGRTWESLRARHRPRGSSSRGSRWVPGEAGNTSQPSDKPSNQPTNGGAVLNLWRGWSRVSLFVPWAWAIRSDSSLLSHLILLIPLGGGGSGGSQHGRSVSCVSLGSLLDLSVCSALVAAAHGVEVLVVKCCRRRGVIEFGTFVLPTGREVGGGWGQDSRRPVSAPPAGGSVREMWFPNRWRLGPAVAWTALPIFSARNQVARTH